MQLVVPPPRAVTDQRSLPVRLLPFPVPSVVLQVGGLLVDGLGDGALIEAPHEDLDFLRTTSFGLLQVRGCGRVLRTLLWCMY
jgi:hypothetical protein